jgi:hypothetical protein
MWFLRGLGDEWTLPALADEAPLRGPVGPQSRKTVDLRELLGEGSRANGRTPGTALQRLAQPDARDADREAGFGSGCHPSQRVFSHAIPPPRLRAYRRGIE